MIQNIKIKAHQAGLVFKNGSLVRVIDQGKHWTWGSESVIVFDKTQPFQSPIELNILLANADFASRVQVVNVSDNELVFQYVNGNFSEVLTAGRYVFWKDVMAYQFVTADLSDINIADNIPKTLLEFQKVRAFTRRFNIAANETGLLFVDGKFTRQLAAGTWQFWNNSTTIEVKTADLRKQQLEITGQELLTKDKAALRISFYVWFTVVDFVKAITQNKDYEKQLYVLMQLALRESTGALALDELLSKKESLGKEILEGTVAKAKAMGIELSEAGIRDVILPGDMKDIMNQVLVAEKKAQANSIMRREETASTRSLLNTAKLMEDNAMLFKLKEMEYVEKIAEKINTISVSGSGQLVDQLKQIFVK
ncbi:slipin family protein [Flavobacterium caeni]|uniref:SPFH domain / Band 7 family protein n=1 Tax=Flavobacterium caeni TaxID=490189 RepID=A0A1G5AM43_9FLAO|nr:slipin family protein [Flavobacterium caeni]SCX78966.1 SPFH domain / Band 7 family protein [Flavobacterium caeni]